MSARWCFFLWMMTTTMAFAQQQSGWFEILPSGGAKQGEYMKATPKATGGMAERVVGARGDKLYYAKRGESLTTIALTVTGSVDNREAIARYNQLDPWAPLKNLQEIIIPVSLLPLQSREPRSSSVIKELSTSDAQLAATQSEPRNSLQVDKGQIGAQLIQGKTESGFTGSERLQRSEALDSSNIDMFAGEVRVLGVVDVSRVAIGSGKVIRAEVLANGELLVIAQEPGSTSLRLWHNDLSQTSFNIRVSEQDPETRFHMEKMVRMKVQMVEFRKSALGKLGIDWSDSIAGPGLATAGDLVGNALYRPASEGFAETLPNVVKPFSSYFGIATNISSRINLLSSSGDAITLAEPVLSCANGGTASFLAGGEVPYPTIGENGKTTVDFKEYGIKLHISPKIDTAGNVQTRLDTEISQLDPAVTVQGAPGLLTRRTQTQVNVRTGETIVISGLLTSETSKDLDRLPGLGKLPVLGALFRSKNARNAVSELVVFITPEVLDPVNQSMGEGNTALLETSLKRLNKARVGLSLME